MNAGCGDDEETSTEETSTEESATDQLEADLDALGDDFTAEGANEPAEIRPRPHRMG